MRRQNRLHRGRDVQGLQRHCQRIGPLLAGQRFGLHERPDAFLQKEGVPLRPRDQGLLERLEARGAAEQGVQQLARALGRQRVEAQLTIICLAAPAVLVVWTVVDEKQDARSRQPLDQAVEQRLGLRVDPVQILEDHEQRLDLTFPQQQPFHGLQGPPPALSRIESGPRGIVDGDIQQRQQRWQQRLQGAVQHQQLARYAFADFPLVVAVLDPEI